MLNLVNNPDPKSYSQLLSRPTKDAKALEAFAESVFQNVKKHGDQALKDYAKQFDGVENVELKVSKKEIDEAESELSEALKGAMQLAKENITKFHTHQKTETTPIFTQPGVECWQEKRPIEAVGLYIPGGSAPLFSTVLMLSIPAKIAGCARIALCSPPDKAGRIAPEIRYAAKLCGVTEIFKVGGAQAIAAMTFGTQTIPSVHKIVGPGNQYVTAAKQLATRYSVAIDMPAGPSEVLVVADDTGVPEFIASDLLSQAEHGSDSQVIFVSTSKKCISEVMIELEKQLKLLPRKQIAEQAMVNSKCIFVDSHSAAIDIINAYAPEHLIVCVKETAYYIKNLNHAGSVFIGNYTPESAGDYASGTNHTLPTNGYARSYSGINLDSFTKSISFQRITKEGLLNIGKAIELMAQAEGLHAHKNAISVRLKD